MRKRINRQVFFGAVLFLAQVWPLVETTPMPEITSFQMHEVEDNDLKTDVVLVDSLPLTPQERHANHLINLVNSPQEITVVPERTSLVHPAEPTAPPTREVVAPEPVKPSIPAVSSNELDSYFETYAQAVNIDSNLLRHISLCESGHNPGAVNGPYGGLFQFSSSTWQSTRNAMGLDPNPDLRFNAEQAVNTAAWKIAHGGIGAWPVCGKRALASK